MQKNRVALKKFATAQKRTESPQDVAITMQAYSGETPSRIAG
jgi:hypothetical protein